MGHQEGAGEERRCAHQGGDPIQSNSEFQSLTSSPTRSPDHLGFKLMYRTHTKSDLDVLYMNGKRTR
jgi:hypothetical protein